MLLVMLKNYTAIYYKKENERNLMEQEKTLNFMFESVVKYCKVFHETKIYEESPKELKFDKTYIQSLEQNLKRKINQFPDTIYKT